MTVVPTPELVQLTDLYLETQGVLEQAIQLDCSILRREDLRQYTYCAKCCSGKQIAKALHLLSFNLVFLSHLFYGYIQIIPKEFRNIVMIWYDMIRYDMMYDMI